MKTEFLWEIFAETGAPEAYLLYKRAGRAQMAGGETAYVSDDARIGSANERI